MTIASVMQDTDWRSRLVDHMGGPIMSRLEDFVRPLSKDEVTNAFADDPWLGNAALAAYEYVNGVVELESFPTNVTLPIADLCNARCTFCTSWLMGREFLKMEDLERYKEVIPHATQFGYQGHGEPLASPHIKGLLAYFTERLDPRCMTYTITNGMFLKKLLPELTKAELNIYNVSLNAASPAVHDKVMGLGPDAFDEVINTLQDIRERTGGRSNYTISMVLTADNFHEAPEFVRLGNRIGASTIYLRTLATIPNITAGLNYHMLPPRLLENFEEIKAQTLAAIEDSEVNVEAQPDTWFNDSISKEARERVTQDPPKIFGRHEAMKDQNVRDQYKRVMERQRSGDGGSLGYTDDLVENPFNRVTPFSCRFVYYNLICTNMSHRMAPCCYMGAVPGFEEVVVRSEKPFRAYWNSQAMMHLRDRLQNGPLFQGCAVCPMQG